MDYLEQYYSSYNEENRLLSRHGQVEYLTTMKYIHEYLGANRNQRILEAGAGTGRYCVDLAREGYRVDALELTECNLSILRSKLTGQEKLTAIQGNVLDMSVYEENTFDMTLVLGPMYHLYCDEDKIQALREAIRVTRPGGYIMVAYCMNDAVIIQEEFMRGAIKEHMAVPKETRGISDDFHYISKPEEVFSVVRIEEIHKLTQDLPVYRLKTIATDGATNYLRTLVNGMDDETFDYWLKYHFCICERQDLIGAANHTLDILKKP